MAFLKKFKNRIAIASGNSTFGYVPRRTKNGVLQEYPHTPVHSSTVHDSWKGEAPSCPSWVTGNWNVVYKQRGVLSLKMRKTVWWVATGRNLEDIMLSEISQSQKDGYCMISLTCSIENSQNHRRKVEGAAGAGGWREMGSYWLTGTEFSFAHFLLFFH